MNKPDKLSSETKPAQQLIKPKLIEQQLIETASLENIAVMKVSGPIFCGLSFVLVSTLCWRSGFWFEVMWFRF